MIHFRLPIVKPSNNIQPMANAKEFKQKCFLRFGILRKDGLQTTTDPVIVGLDTDKAPIMCNMFIKMCTDTTNKGYAKSKLLKVILQ